MISFHPCTLFPEVSMFASLRRSRYMILQCSSHFHNYIQLTLCVSLPLSLSLLPLSSSLSQPPSPLSPRPSLYLSRAVNPQVLTPSQRAPREENVQSTKINQCHGRTIPLKQFALDYFHFYLHLDRFLQYPNTYFFFLLALRV